MIRHQWFVLGKMPRSVAWGMVVAGAVAAAVGVAADPQRTWPNLLLNGFYLIALALAGMLFISFQYLSGAAWSANLRRIPEAARPPTPMVRIVAPDPSKSAPPPAQAPPKVELPGVSLLEELQAPDHSAQRLLQVV